LFYKQEMKNTFNALLLIALILCVSTFKLRTNTKQVLEGTNYALVNRNGNAIRMNAKIQKLLSGPLDGNQANYWTFERNPNGSFKIRSTSQPTQVMTVANISVAENGFLWTNDFWGGNNQKWFVDPIDQNTVMFRVMHTGKCMSLNVDITQLTCNASDPRQLWTLKVQPAPGFPINTPVAVVNRGTGRCANMNANLSAIKQAPCINTQTQFWTIVGNAGYWQVKSTVNSQEFDILNINKADGAYLINWTNWNGPNQKFSIEPVGDAFMIRASHSGKCIYAEGDGYTQRPCDSFNTNQLFTFKAQPPQPIIPNTDYMIVNDGNGMCVRFQGNTTKVAHVPCYQMNEQFWTFTKNPDNAYHIMTRASNQVLTVKDISLADGYVIWVNVIWGGNNQKWYVDYINSRQFMLKNMHSGKCFSTKAGSSDAVQYPCNSQDPAQIYTLRTKAPPSQPVSGSLIDATTGLPLPTDAIASTTITFTNNATGDVTTVVPNPDGTWSANLPNGTYTMCIETTGYITTCTQITVNNAPLVIPPITISPVVHGSRAVLTWNAIPKDLDIRATSSAGQVVYFRNKVAGAAKLDVDNTRGNGPETITIGEASQDTWKITVSNFSKELPLKSSGAKLDVYIGDRLASSTTVPDLDGNTWDVLTIDNRAGSVDVINHMSA
jgi:hypothetical protein